jgi:hypothetical protein
MPDNVVTNLEKIYFYNFNKGFKALQFSANVQSIVKLWVGMP